MVDEGFHVFFHGGSGRRGDFVVFDSDGSGGHLVEALVDDAQALSEFFHAAEVAIVAVSVDTDRDIEFYVSVRVVRLAFSYIPRHAGPAQHDAGERVVERVGGGDDADAFGATDPDAVVGEELFGFVNAVAELGRPLVDVVEEAEGNIGVHAAGADIGGVEAGAGDTLVEFL